MTLQDNTDVAEILRKCEDAIAFLKAGTPETPDAFALVEEVWPLIESIPPDTPDIRSTRAVILYYLAFANSRKGLFDDAIAYISESIHIFTELDPGIRLVSAVNGLGLLHLNKGAYAEALDIFLSNLEPAISTGNRMLIGQVYKNIGRAHWSLGNNREGIEYTKQSLLIAETLPNRTVLISTYMNIGNMYASTDELVPALEYYLRGLELAEQYHAGYLNTIAQLLMNIGGIFLRMGDYDRALEYYTRSRALQEELDRPVEMARLYSNIGELYRERGEFSLASDYLLQSAEAYDKLRLHHEKAYILALLCGVMLLMNEPDVALTHGMESMSIAETGNDRRTLVLAIHAVARVHIYRGEYRCALEKLHTAKELYAALGSTTGELDVLVDVATISARQQQPEEALSHLLAAYALATGKHAEKPVVARVHHMLAETYEQAGNDRLALVYFKAFRDLEKTIFSEKSEYRVQTLRVLHEVEKAQKEAEIHRLKNEQLERDMEHLRHDLVVHALHLAQRQDLLYKTRRELHNISRGVVQNIHEEVRSTGRAIDKALLKMESEQEGKRDVLQKVRQNLAAIENDMKSRLQGNVTSVLQHLDSALTDETLWEQFALQYRQVHGKFLDSLSAAFPRLSATELKVCALIHINMSSKEIGRILTISSRSVDTYRYNIRQKIGISSEVNLGQYMAELAQKSR